MILKQIPKPVQCLKSSAELRLNLQEERFDQGNNDSSPYGFAMFCQYHIVSKRTTAPFSYLFLASISWPLVLQSCPTDK
ncbi:hypothetical protein QQP08_026190 [Theobroma cacao]|nr:hypothetical protein QQP08_026190 [Theobroma cacao]